MIVTIEAPEYIRQWLINYQLVKGYSTNKEVFEIHHKHHLPHVMSLYFRRPKSTELVKDHIDGLKIKLSHSMVKDMKIYLSERNKKGLIDYINKAMYDNFLVDVQTNVVLGMKDRDAIYNWLEQNNIECDTQTFNRFEKKFYRSLPVSEKRRKINYTPVLSETVRNCPKHA